MLHRIYYGTKRVEAWPAPNPNPKVEQPDEGYAVKYADGYTSWSPKDVFEATYKPETAMDFAGALTAMREGRKVRRSKWTYTDDDGQEKFWYLCIENDYLTWKDGNGDTITESWEEYDTISDDILATDWMVVA